MTGGGNLNGREGLSAALGDLAARKANALVVAKLDRLSRSTADFGKVVARCAGTAGR